MKKTITLVSSFALGIIISNAQITITSADVVGIGKVVYQATDTIKSLSAGGINPGSAGANKTWNFSNLLAAVVDTSTITNPAWTTSGPSFPASNLASVSNNGFVSYLINNSTGLYADGAFGNLGGLGTMAINLNPNELITSFPNTYNSTFQNTSNISMTIPVTGVTGVDSARFKEIKYKSVLTDAWGSVTTPLGTYPCIRQKGMVLTTDSIWVHSNLFPIWTFFQKTVDTSWHFSWWANGVGLPLVEFDSTAGDTIRNITWLKTTPVIGGVSENPMLSLIQVYPNPSNGLVHVAVPSQVKEYSADVFNLTGIKVSTFSAIGAKNSGLDISALPDGIYLMRITTPQGVVSRKLIVNK